MNQELFAFWKYDCLPYYLGDEIINITETGFVEVVNWPGYKFKPVKIIPKEQGLIIKEQLEQLEKEYVKELEILKNNYDKKINKIME